jgi:TPR repeat protein
VTVADNALQSSVPNILPFLSCPIRLNRVRRINCFALVVLSALLCVPLPACVRAADIPVPDGYLDALGWYGRAAESGDSEAQYYLGMMLERGLRAKADPVAALRWYQRAAVQGHAEAAFRLGSLLELGHGVAKNRSQAAAWYQKAAEGGVARAQFNLALMFGRGLGVERDLKAALTWFEKAAEGGIAEAWPQLALHYAIGAGGERDPQKALMALEIGAALGQGDNAAFRETLIAKLSPGQIAAAKRQAMARLQKRAP